MKNIFILLILTFMCSNMQAQDISDLGVIWEKVYTPVSGAASNMRTNRNKDGYVLAGYNGQSGVVMEINENGDIIRSVTTDIRTIYTPISETARAYFTIAFKTDDGGILAFGHFQDKGAPNADKMTNYSGLSMDENSVLLNGIWLVKYDKDLKIVKNQRLRGARLEDGWQTLNGNFVIVGLDQPREGVAGSSNDISLIRIFNQDGNLVKDGRANYSHITALYQYPGTDNFIMSSNGSLMKLNVANNIVTISDVAVVSKLGLKDMVFPFVMTVSPTVDGGLFFSSCLSSNSNVQTNFNNGRGFYRLGANYSQQYYWTSKPLQKEYQAPLYLESNIYVGNYTLHENVSTSTRYMYQLVDDGTFNVKIGAPLPIGTVIRQISSSDGFFAIGGQNGAFKVAKLSTCANFRVTTLPLDYRYIIPYNPSITLNFPLNYVGAKGTVTYTLKAEVIEGTVDNKVAGEVLENIPETTAQVSGSSGLVLDLNRNYNLGTEYAIIEYTLFIKDTYQIAGVDQSCGQTYIFRVITAPQTAIVAMPLLKVEGSTNKVIAAVKNIGQAPFSNYKVTIYKDNVGNATKQTYTYPNKIEVGETVHLDIALDPSMVGASQYVVQFNDDGSGSQSQLELSNEQTEYEVDVE